MKNISQLKNLIDQKEKAQQQAQIANQAKSKFLANMSHEIRTPLNGIVGTAETFPNTNLTNEQDEALEIIKMSSQHLSRLLNNILDISKIDANKLDTTIELCDVDKLTKDIISLHKNQALEKGLTINYHYNAVTNFIETDPTKYKQIFNNLLSNAIKFSKEKGIIDVSLSIEKFKLTLEIKDYGIGISPDQIKNLFQPFSQANEKISNQFGGTGLGLAISKELLKLLDGEISVKSQLNEGAEFQVTMNFQKDVSKIKTPELKPEQKEDYEPLAKKVVIIDDNEINLKVAKNYLKHLNFEEVLSFSSPTEGFNYLKNNKFDLLLLDLKMPKLDGYELFEKLKSQYNKNEFTLGCVIAFSANAYQDDIKKCLNLGFDDHLLKPASKKVLYEKLLKHGLIKYKRS